MAKAARVSLDYKEALAELWELLALSRRYGFELGEELRKMAEIGSGLLCCKVDTVPAVGAGAFKRVARYKLPKRLANHLAALRARDRKAHKIKRGSSRGGAR